MPIKFIDLSSALIINTQNGSNYLGIVLSEKSGESAVMSQVKVRRGARSHSVERLSSPQECT